MNRCINRCPQGPISRRPGSWVVIGPLLAAAAMVFGLLFMPSTGSAFIPVLNNEEGVGSSAEAALCGMEVAAADLDALEQRILDARSLDLAREIATTDTRLAQDVLGRARWLAPGGTSLMRASERLERYHDQVARASSRSDIVQGLRDITSGSPSIDSGCDYTGLEIFAIVLGFILGIIPGLILLVLLC